MDWAFFLQVFVDLILVGAVAWFWLERQVKVPAMESALPTSEDLRQELQGYRVQVAEQLRLLKSVCDQAKRILEGKQSVPTLFPPSFEENEIKNFVAKKAETEIPTLQQFELAKERLRSESQLDLRTVLKDQLS